MRRLGAGVLLGAVLAVGAAQATPEAKLEPAFKKGGHIHGYLITPAGHGLDGIVTLCTVDGKRMTYHETYRMRRGRFDIDNVEPGRYKLHVPTIGPWITDLKPPADLEIEVRRGKVIRPKLIAR